MSSSFLRVIASSLIGGLALLGASACSPAEPPREASQHIVFTAAGDSITSGYEGVEGWPAFAQSDDVRYEGGLFEVGLTSDQIVDGAIARGAEEADVLVVMGCTNDILAGTDHAHCLEQWERLGSAISAPLLMAAIAPSNVKPAEGLAYNADLAQLASDRGWGFVDPWTDSRATDGTYVEGMNRVDINDLVHPGRAAVASAGERIREAIQDFRAAPLSTSR